MELAGKTTLITGGGSGIGAETARYMAARGAAVALAGIPSVDLETVAFEITKAGGQALSIETDVTIEGDIEAAIAATIEAFGSLNAVIANAGVQRHQTDVDLFSMTEDEWEHTQDVNLRGVFRTCKHGLARMIDQRDGGSIVIVSSITALNGRTPNVSYMTAKSALLGLNRHIAVHYAKHGIRCNAVCPGAFLTAGTAEHAKAEGKTLEEICFSNPWLFGVEIPLWNKKRLRICQHPLK